MKLSEMNLFEPKEPPVFTHECESCVYLGRHGDYDLYHCPGIFGGTLLARYDNEPHQYLSSNVDMHLNGQHNRWYVYPEGQAMFHACVRAVARGLDKGQREPKFRSPKHLWLCGLLELNP